MTEWAWMDLNGSGHPVWIRGTLAESYARAAEHGGRWVLYSANPVSEYHRVMAETAKFARKEGNG